MLTANREGIVSLPGFLSIVLIAMGIGSDIYQTLIYKDPAIILKEHKSKEGLEVRRQSEVKAFFRMVVYSIILFIASELGISCLDKPSRRLCNMSWVLY